MKRILIALAIVCTPLSPVWSQHVLKKSRLEGVFLTNDFDDPLEGFDTRVYIPCLRTDDLVFKLGTRDVQARFQKATGVSPGNAAALRQGIGKLFTHFVKNNAKACAISLPPDFSPQPVTPAAGTTRIGCC